MPDRHAQRPAAAHEGYLARDPFRLLADYFLVRGPRVVVDALARMEGDSVEHADLHADFAELRKPPSLPTQRCASFAFSRTCTPPAQLSLWRTGWR